MTNKRAEKWSAYLIGISVALGLAMFSISAFQHGCSAQQCTIDELSPNEPATTYGECPAGELCYQGQCVRACLAGTERADESTCSNSSECSGSQPNCVDGYCSACEEREKCIPHLNICGTALDVLDPPPPSPINTKVHRPATDGGQIDGYSLIKDAAGTTQVERDPTHTGLVDISHVVDLRGTNPQLDCNATAVFEDRTGTTINQEEETIHELGQCEIVREETFTGASPQKISLGKLTIEDNACCSNSIAVPITMEFGMGQYGITAPVPHPCPLLTYSVLDTANEIHERRWIDVTSTGVQGITDGSWPDPAPEFGLHVPFELIPEPQTMLLIQSEIIVDQTPQDLEFAFIKIGETGAVNTEKVYIRIPGPGFHIICRQEEGFGTVNIIELKSDTLALFRTLVPAGSYPLNFERASYERLSVPPHDLELLYIEVIGRVRHTLVGEITL